MVSGTENGNIRRQAVSFILILFALTWTMTKPAEVCGTGNEIGIYTQNSYFATLITPWSVPNVFRTQRYFVYTDTHVGEGEALISDITMRGPPF